MQALTLDAIRQTAPSVFAEHAYAGTSERYRFFPTSQIVVGLMHEGFLPVRAQQSRCRLEDKQDYTKHMLRFRHAHGLERQVDTIVPEVVLINGHDGTSAYNLSLGLFRVRCTNGLVVKSEGISDLRVRHSGRASLVDEVIEASYAVIQDAPKALAQVETWQHLQLSAPEQEAFAEAVVELRETSLEVRPSELLRLRRRDDASPHAWMTMNVIQENLMRGGARGQNAEGHRTRLTWDQEH